MQISINPNMSANVYHFGDEQSPLLVVDNFLNNAEELIEDACQKKFVKNSPMYPGVRAPVPISFQSLFLGELGPQLREVFELKGERLRLSMCQYSIVTVPPDQLGLLQRIPHFDSNETDELAAIYYLSKEDLGGTSFYRHNKTGYEAIDTARRIPYLRSLESENGSDNIPKSGYINGDTALFTRIGEQKAIFNRLIVYRRKNLHSGSISADFIPDSNPRTGRLTISIFIDCM